MDRSTLTLGLGDIFPADAGVAVRGVQHLAGLWSFDGTASPIVGRAPALPAGTSGLAPIPVDIRVPRSPARLREAGDA